MDTIIRFGINAKPKYVPITRTPSVVFCDWCAPFGFYIALRGGGALCVTAAAYSLGERERGGRAGMAPIDEPR